jgi:hypothetical protein
MRSSREEHLLWSKWFKMSSAVSRVLEKLHLPGYQKPTASTTRHIFSDNTAITVGQVLQHFNWTVATYQKKATAYRWATEASSWTYTKGVPGM